jgi:hypothetical protein
MYSLMMAVASNFASAFTQHKTPLLSTRTRSVSAQQFHHRLHRQRLSAVAGPAELADAVTAGLDQAPTVAATLAQSSAPAASNLESSISSMYTASANVFSGPAHEHTQPFWGTPDPFLSAGKSIAPTVQGMQELGISKRAVTDVVSQAPEGLADKVQSALTKGWKVLDFNNVQTQDGLPGFMPTRSILAAHEIGIPAETSDTFASQVEWSASFLTVVDKLPYIALSYALIEFFLLRPGVDLYQQDIDDNPEQVLAETVLVTAVRMGVFAVVATVTVSIFG